jgi:prolyl oligopeptidase
MAVLPTIASGQNQNNSLSETKGETVDQYFDAKVADPYRWLETIALQKLQLGLRLKRSDLWLFRQIPFRDALKNRMEKCGITEK